VADLEPIDEVPAATYYRFPGIAATAPFTVPDTLNEAVKAFQSADPTKRAQFRRAAYWFDRARAASEISTSLSFISLINAIEVLSPNQATDLCELCGKNRAPGPTALFRETVEQYAGKIPDRDALYRVRSSLVHGDKLLLADEASGLAFTPEPAHQRWRYDQAFRVSRAVIVNWLLRADATQGVGSQFGR
jgi:hypothetical protein